MGQLANHRGFEPLHQRILQLQLLADFWLICSAENQSRWFSYPIDATIGQ
jgi:hypothetical protein